MTFLEVVLQLADSIEAIANLLLVGAVLRFWWNRQFVEIRLSVGSFRIRRKDISLVNITGVVSERFFSGGWLPDEVRKEILILTNPEIRDVVSNRNPDSSASVAGTPPPLKS